MITLKGVISGYNFIVDSDGSTIKFFLNKNQQVKNCHCFALFEQLDSTHYLLINYIPC